MVGLEYVRNGNHVVIASKTSSGKSLIYQLPILKGLYESDQFRALAIFPTKVNNTGLNIGANSRSEDIFGQITRYIISK